MYFPAKEWLWLNIHRFDPYYFRHLKKIIYNIMRYSVTGSTGNFEFSSGGSNPSISTITFTSKNFKKFLNVAVEKW